MCVSRSPLVIDNLANCLYVELNTGKSVLPTTLKELMNQEFNDDQVKTFCEFIERHAKIFCQGRKLRRSLAVKHEIHLKNNQLFRITIRGYSNAHREVIKKEFPEMLVDDFIEPTSSSNASTPLIQTLSRWTCLLDEL